MTVAKMLNVCRAIFPSGPSQLAAVLSKETSLGHHMGPDNSLRVKLWITEPDANADNTAPTHSQLSHPFTALFT